MNIQIYNMLHIRACHVRMCAKKRRNTTKTTRSLKQPGYLLSLEHFSMVLGDICLSIIHLIRASPLSFLLLVRHYIFLDSDEYSLINI